MHPSPNYQLQILCGSLTSSCCSIGIELPLDMIFQILRKDILWVEEAQWTVFMAQSFLCSCDGNWRFKSLCCGILLRLFSNCNLCFIKIHLVVHVFWHKVPRRYICVNINASLCQIVSVFSLNPATVNKKQSPALCSLC